MTKRFIYIICLCIMCIGAKAQCTSVNNAFQMGERIIYDLKFNWKFVWVDAGTAIMDVNGTDFQGQRCYKSRLLCNSNKAVDKFFLMRDTLVSILGQDMEPLYFRKGSEEGKRYSVDEGWFSYKNGKCCVNQHRDVRGKERQSQDIEYNECVLDMLSIVLRARTFDASMLKEGDRTYWWMATGRAIDEKVLIYRGKKNFKAEDKKNYRCLVFSLFEHKNGMDTKEVITFYVTDDENHLPVRLDLNLNFGCAKAYMKSVEGNRHPLTSIVED